MASIVVLSLLDSFIRHSESAKESGGDKARADGVDTDVVLNEL